MDVERLVHMANNIGNFFAAEPDKAKGAKGVADHIRNFWEPRMRRQILAHIDKTSGAGLSDIVLKALTTHGQELGG